MSTFAPAFSWKCWLAAKKNSVQKHTNRGHWTVAYLLVEFLSVFSQTKTANPKNPGLSWDIWRMGLDPLIPL